MTRSRLWLALFAGLGTLVVTTTDSRAQEAFGVSPGGAPAAIATPGAGMTNGFALDGTDAIESPINPDTYVLGPGDGLVVGVWGENPVRYPLNVTLEGKILLPTLGEIIVQGLTLREAETLLSETITEHYRNVRVTLTLQRVRFFQVPITGQVHTPGLQSMRVVDRASIGLARAGGIREGGSQRRIQITNTGEVRGHVDLFRFRVIGDLEANPVLHNGDQLHVPHANEFVWVYGAVHAPGPFEFVPGDRLGEVLAFAGGTRPEAVHDTIEVARFDGTDDAIRFDVVRTELEDGREIFVRLDTPSSTVDFELMPTDRVFVRTRGEWREREVATIEGEINYPGTYPITEGETRILDLLQRAGGLTDEASVEEAFIVRETVSEGVDQEFERLKRMPPESMSADEYEYLKMRERELPGLMVVNFEQLLGGDDGQNIDVVDGDRIVIPRKKDYVSVLGMVVRPGNITFRPGLDVRQYVDQAGGYSDRADTGETRVIRVNSPTWIEPDEIGELRPGDTIWVPERVSRDYWRSFRDGLLVATQILALYVVVDAAAN